MLVKEIFFKLGKKESLENHEMTRLMEMLMTGALRDPEIEEFLVLLRQKGESAEEIAAAAQVMRKHALKLSKGYPELVDTCGTGGDARQSLNVSTLAALTTASMGVPVGKHGNRSVSSQCGSADLLEALGFRIDLPPSAIEESIERYHFGFFFAPKFHGATRAAMPARKKIGGKTLFNVLGPLSNPAGALYQLLGVYEDRLVETLADTLLALGSSRALVVHGEDGMDEITLCGKTKIAELDKGRVKVYTVSPEDFGLKKAAPKDLVCPTKEACKAAALQVLHGQAGPFADIVALNAGAALYLGGRAGSLGEGVHAAAQTLSTGSVYGWFERLSSWTQEQAP